MVREARALIEAGSLGPALGWVSGTNEGDSKQAAWRTDPAQAGASFTVGDLGTYYSKSQPPATSIRSRTVPDWAKQETRVPATTIKCALR
jgi:hypothetical protein